MDNLFTTNSVFTIDSAPRKDRGRVVSIEELYGPRMKRQFIGDSKVYDANFAFLTTALAKLHKEVYEPMYFVTWQEDVPFDIGGGFVDYVEYRTIDWAGVMASYRNVVGNNANFIPRVNAAMNQKRVNVYTYQVAYDLRFIELEKLDKLALQKSIQDVYNDAIVAGWDLFVQSVAYTGLDQGEGLFTSEAVKISAISNTGTTGKGFAGLTDDQVVAFFNGVFETYLSESNMNINILPDTFLVPTFVMRDLVSRYSPLYVNTLYDFIIDHNLGIAQARNKELKIRITGRPALDKLGTAQKGRIVAYKNHRNFVRIDIPYPVQHYITLPNIDKMSYTSAFVGQVSEIQLPYNVNNGEFGVVSYWDFTEGNE